MLPTTAAHHDDHGDVDRADEGGQAPVDDGPVDHDVDVEQAVAQDRHRDRDREQEEGRGQDEQQLQLVERLQPRGGDDEVTDPLLQLGVEDGEDGEGERPACRAPGRRAGSGGGTRGRPACSARPGRPARRRAGRGARPRAAGPASRPARGRRRGTAPRGRRERSAPRGHGADQRGTNRPSGNTKRRYEEAEAGQRPPELRSGRGEHADRRGEPGQARFGPGQAGQGGEEAGGQRASRAAENNSRAGSRPPSRTPGRGRCRRTGRRPMRRMVTSPAVMTPSDRTPRSTRSLDQLRLHGQRPRVDPPGGRALIDEGEERGHRQRPSRPRSTTSQSDAGRGDDAVRAISGRGRAHRGVGSVARHARGRGCSPVWPSPRSALLFLSSPLALLWLGWFLDDGLGPDLPPGARGGVRLAVRRRLRRRRRPAPASRPQHRRACSRRCSPWSVLAAVEVLASESADPLLLLYLLPVVRPRRAPPGPAPARLPPLAAQRLADRRGPAPRCPPLLLMAFDELDLASRRVGGHVEHWGAMAAFAFTMIGLIVIACLRPPGWRVSAWCAGGADGDLCGDLGGLPRRCLLCPAALRSLGGGGAGLGRSPFVAGGRAQPRPTASDRNGSPPESGPSTGRGHLPPHVGDRGHRARRPRSSSPSWAAEGTPQIPHHVTETSRVHCVSCHFDGREPGHR